MSEPFDEAGFRLPENSYEYGSHKSLSATSLKSGAEKGLGSRWQERHITLPNPGDQKGLPINFNPNEDSIEQTPRRPMSGNKLPVFGISGAGAAAGAGVGATAAIRIG
jgi:hypothetical protein